MPAAPRMLSSLTTRRCEAAPESAVRVELERNSEQLERIRPELLRARDAGQAAVSAQFVRRPCREAPCPAQPLLRIGVGSEVLYRGHDGICYAALRALDR